MFDNVTDLAAIRDVLPPAGDGRVLITTRDARWPAAQVLDVPVLDVETAAGFLVSRTGRAGQEDAARELAAELGGLPLALEQAAAYMQASGRSIGEYLEMFRQRSLDLMGRGEAAGYGKQVTTTWALAFDQIQQGAPGAAGLLRLLACCAPDAVPLRLLLQPRPALSGTFGPEVGPLLEPLLADPLAVDDAVTVLRRFSLISAPQDGAVSVHRLVQAVTLAPLPEETAGAWRQAAAALIEAALPADPQLPAALAGVRGAGAARPGSAGSAQRRHGPDRQLPGVQRELGCGPRPVPADPRRPGAGPRPGAPGHPDRPRRTCPLDRGSVGRGRGARSARGATAGPRAGVRRAAPGHPDHPRQPRTGPRRREIRPGAGPVRGAAARSSGCSARTPGT